MPTTLLPAPPDFQTFLRPCNYEIISLFKYNLFGLKLSFGRPLGSNFGTLSDHFGDQGIQGVT